MYVYAKKHASLASRHLLLLRLTPAAWQAARSLVSPASNPPQRAQPERQGVTSRIKDQETAAAAGAGSAVAVTDEKLLLLQITKAMSLMFESCPAGAHRMLLKMQAV